MNKEKLRILIISPIPPMPSWGTAMIFYRHFCDRSDFEIRVITDNTQILGYKIPYPYLLISKGKIWSRLSRTRFYKVIHTFNHLIGYFTIPQPVLNSAIEFKPHVVLTAAGSWSWMAIMARDVATKLKVPLVGSFMDWWSYNVINHPWFDRLLEKKFKKYYNDCDLSLCISEGMKEALGAKKEAVVLYPLGPLIQFSENMVRPKTLKYKVAFGGNVGEWYGKMLERLISLEPDSIQFSIYGNNPSWSAEFDKNVRKKNIYHGHISFEELQIEMAKQDALILLMGFGTENYQVEKTSFKSKFIDYLTFQKPILVWGPEYCTAVEIARKYDSAEVCTSPDASDFLAAIDKLSVDETRQKELISNGQKMYNDVFHPEKIHQQLKEAIETIVKNYNK